MRRLVGEAAYCGRHETVNYGLALSTYDLVWLMYVHVNSNYQLNCLCPGRHRTHELISSSF